MLLRDRMIIIIIDKWRMKSRQRGRRKESIQLKNKKHDGIKVDREKRRLRPCVIYTDMIPSFQAGFSFLFPLQTFYFTCWWENLCCFPPSFLLPEIGFQNFTVVQLYKIRVYAYTCTGLFIHEKWSNVLEIVPNIEQLHFLYL